MSETLVGALIAGYAPMGAFVLYLFHRYEYAQRKAEKAVDKAADCAINCAKTEAQVQWLMQWNHELEERYRDLRGQIETGEGHDVR